MGIKNLCELVFPKLGFEPTLMQWPIFFCTHREILVAGGWRAGKSFIGAMVVVLKTLSGAKSIWLIGKNYDSCREEFKYIHAALLKLGLIVGKPSFPAQGSCSLITKTGCLIDTHSAEDVIKIGMSAPDFVMICEAAQITLDAYLRIRGRVMETRGSIIMTGTFEQSLDWYTKYYNMGQGDDPDVKSFSLPSWSNTVIFPLGRNDPEILKAEERLGSLFTQYCAAEPCQPLGIVLPEFSNEIHCKNYPRNPNYEPEYPVEITVDPGYGGAYAVLAVQRKETIPYVVDEIYLRGYTTEDVILIAKQRPWFPKVQAGVIDIAGKQHQAMAAPIEVWQERAGLYLESHYVDVEEGISAFRTALSVNPITKKPRCYFNSCCHGIISEMGGCESPLEGGGVWIRDINTGKIIDKNNHSTKAFIYWYTLRYGYTNRQGNNFGKLYKPDKTGMLQPVGGREREWLKLKT